MITAEKVYEVFGIKPGPWEWVVQDVSMITLGSKDCSIEGQVMSVSPCQSCIDMAKGGWEWGRCTTPNQANAHLIAVVPELLVALIEIIINTEQHYEATEDPLTDERFEDDYGYMVKIIEKTDYKNRTWSELKKELLK